MNASITLEPAPPLGTPTLLRVRNALFNRAHEPERVPPRDARLRRDIGLDDEGSEQWGREAAELYLRG